MKWIRWAGGGLGLLLVVLILRQVDLQLVRELLTRIGWKGAWLLVYPLSWIFANSYGWMFAFHPQTQLPSFIRLTAIRMAGETFNSLLPSGYVGGEPIKIQLLSKWISRQEAAASVLVSKSAQSVGLVLYVGIGLCIPHVSGSLFQNRLLPLIAFSVLAAGVGVFVLLLANQAFSRAGSLIVRITKSHWMETQLPRLQTLDQLLSTFYVQEKKRFLLSSGWQFVAWVAGSMELVLIFHLLGESLHWRDAWFMGSLAQLGMILGLIAPGGIGFFEGGHVMAATLLGLPPSFGLAISLIRRLRELVWNMVGLSIFWKLSKS